MYTLPETNSKFAPENGGKLQVRFISFSRGEKFSGALAVSFREGNCFVIHQAGLDFFPQKLRVG